MFCVPLSCECTILNSHVLPSVVPRVLLKNMIGTVDQDICHILWNPKVHYHFHHLPSPSYDCSAHFQAMASHFLSPVTRMSSCYIPAFGIMQFSSILPHFVYPAVLLFFSRPSSSDISFQNLFWDPVIEHPYYMPNHSNLYHACGSQGMCTWFW